MAKDLIKGTPWYMHAAMLVSVILFVVSCFIPPYAVIDSSILAASGMLLGGATLMNFVVNIPTYLEAGVKAKISHGQTTIAVAADEVKEDAEDL